MIDFWYVKKLKKVLDSYNIMWYNSVFYGFEIQNRGFRRFI